MFVITNGEAYLCNIKFHGYKFRFFKSKGKAIKYDTRECANEDLEDMQYGGHFSTFKVEPYAV